MGSVASLTKASRDKETKSKRNIPLKVAINNLKNSKNILDEFKNGG